MGRNQLHSRPSHRKRCVLSEELHILVVDDDRMMAKTLTDILNLRGYRAESANAGLEALERITSSFGSAHDRPFDCVCSDIRMTGMTGIELQRAIKALGINLAFVLMTAYSADKLVQEGLAEGAIAALAKPLRIEELLSLLTRIRGQESDHPPGQ